MEFSKIINIIINIFKILGGFIMRKFNNNANGIITIPEDAHIVIPTSTTTIYNAQGNASNVAYGIINKVAVFSEGPRALIQLYKNELLSVPTGVNVDASQETICFLSIPCGKWVDITRYNAQYIRFTQSLDNAVIL